MTGIIIEYDRFVDVQQRRARIATELGQAQETPAPRTPLTAIESIEVSQPPAPVSDVKTTRGAVDGR